MIMSVWALADFHLSFGTPNKSMEVFGPSWKNWTENIKLHCENMIKNEDLLLIAGDISWANNLDNALKDLEWIDKLPGKKIIIKGNHDYWWPSLKKLNEALPESIQALHNNAITLEDISIAGTRLWDSDEFNFNDIIKVTQNPFAPKSQKSYEELSIENQKIFNRELTRLQMSLDKLDQKANHKIVMLHYPPIGLNMEESKVHKILKSYHVDICVFGHLHSIETKDTLFGEKDGIAYHLTSCDYLNFQPKKLL